MSEQGVTGTDPGVSTNGAQNSSSAPIKDKWNQLVVDVQTSGAWRVHVCPVLGCFFCVKPSVQVTWPRIRMRIADVNESVRLHPLCGTKDSSLDFRGDDVQTAGM